jgi:tetratricopeptide (TPR) repeat protein
MNALSEASHRTNEVAAPIAERAALTAIRVDSEDPWAHHALGIAYLFMRRFDDSLAEFELALRLNPNFSLAQGYYSLTFPIAGVGRRPT